MSYDDPVSPHASLVGGSIGTIDLNSDRPYFFEARTKATNGSIFVAGRNRTSRVLRP
jgi:hypothetical protein